MKIACIQFEPFTFQPFHAESLPNAVEENLWRAEPLLEQAKRENADLALLPELFHTAYLPRRLGSVPPEILRSCFEKTDSFLSEQARNREIAIAAGVAEPAQEGLYNAVRVYDASGALLSRYRKAALFSPAGEPDVFQRGAEPAVFSLGGFTAGILICYDIRFPELSRPLMDSGCDVILVCAAFPHSRLDHWSTLLTSRAIENQMYVASCNHVGTCEGLRFGGSSMIIAPDGRLLAGADDWNPAVITSDLRKESLDAVRSAIPCHEDRRSILASAEKKRY